ELPHVGCFVAGSVIYEEDYFLHSVPLRICEEVGEMTLELSAPSLLIPIEDESVPDRREERDEYVSPSVVAWRENFLLLASGHPFCFNLRIEGGPRLVLKRAHHPLFARAGAIRL